MSYAIGLTATAQADIRETTRRRRDTASGPVARKWLADLFETISSLMEQDRRGLLTHRRLEAALGLRLT